ncbi:hypothetical protein B0H11DRAFT_2254804 [Mycena galericulata]|nr:hypothetical protein B0H11DRAFT_2254804 [Mycena galericulata]
MRTWTRTLFARAAESRQESGRTRADSGRDATDAPSGDSGRGLENVGERTGGILVHPNVQLCTTGRMYENVLGDPPSESYVVKVRSILYLRMMTRTIPYPPSAALAAHVRMHDQSSRRRRDIDIDINRVYTYYTHDASASLPPPPPPHLLLISSSASPPHLLLLISSSSPQRHSPAPHRSPLVD